MAWTNDLDLVTQGDDQHFENNVTDPRWVVSNITGTNTISWVDRNTAVMGAGSLKFINASGTSRCDIAVSETAYYVISEEDVNHSLYLSFSYHRYAANLSATAVTTTVKDNATGTVYLTHTQSGGGSSVLTVTDAVVKPTKTGRLVINFNIVNTSGGVDRGGEITAVYLQRRRRSSTSDFSSTDVGGTGTGSLTGWSTD